MHYNHYIDRRDNMSRRTKKLLGILCAVMLLAGAAGISKASFNTGGKHLPGEDVVELTSLDVPRC